MEGILIPALPLRSSTGRHSPPRVEDAEAAQRRHGPPVTCIANLIEYNIIKV